MGEEKVSVIDAPRIEETKITKTPDECFPCLDSDGDGVTNANDPCPQDPDCK